MTNTIKIFRWGDSLVGLILLCAVLFSLPVIADTRPKVVDIYKDSNLIATFPLTDERQYVVYGIEDSLKLEIRKNAVSVIDVHCPHKLCMKSGKISLQGQQIVCAPNHILIRISGSQHLEDTPDGIAR